MPNSKDRSNYFYFRTFYTLTPPSEWFISPPPPSSPSIHEITYQLYTHRPPPLVPPPVSSSSFSFFSASSSSSLTLIDYLAQFLCQYYYATQDTAQYYEGIIYCGNEEKKESRVARSVVINLFKPECLFKVVKSDNSGTCGYPMELTPCNEKEAEERIKTFQQPYSIFKKHNLFNRIKDYIPIKDHKTAKELITTDSKSSLNDYVHPRDQAIVQQIQQQHKPYEITQIGNNSPPPPPFPTEEEAKQFFTKLILIKERVEQEIDVVIRFERILGDDYFYHREYELARRIGLWKIIAPEAFPDIPV